MKTVCEKNKCAGCMACVDICPKNAIIIEDTLSAYNAVIDKDKCVECQACHKVCQQNNPLLGKSPIEWYQGWAIDKNIHLKCSSGGFATAISLAFVKAGGYVYGCVFENGEFRFKKAACEKDIDYFIGSKYVKSNPSGIYKQIIKDLKNGNKVLFIGLPCQVAALKNYVEKKLEENLYTADLICHGTPSPQLLNIFLKQYNRPIESMQQIIFRVKAKMQIHGDGTGIITKGVSDKYTIAFLNSLTYTENCYECNYACRSRVSDITLGDSWGSNLPIETRKEGISLALCQTTKGADILKAAEVNLLEVDLERAIANNHQLERPSIMPPKRYEFFEAILKGKSFNRKIFMYFPKQCIKQDIKEVLIYLGIIHGGDK